MKIFTSRKDGTDEEKAKKIAADCAKEKFEGSNINIASVIEKNGIYKVEGDATSSTGEIKYFSVQVNVEKEESKLREEKSPWSITSSR